VARIEEQKLTDTIFGNYIVNYEKYKFFFNTIFLQKSLTFNRKKTKFFERIVKRSSVV
jgi:hypothetical protein